MERDPLIVPPAAGSKTKNLIIALLAVAFAGTLVASIVLGVKLHNSGGAPTPTPPSPSPSPPSSPSAPSPAPYQDPSLDFPLFPASPWDITKNHDRPVTFSTTEGTWMSLDLYQNTLVFDMLGDIYTLPATGGTATPLITGVAWTTQPRWSPDGQYVLYTSDASGCDNIWLYSVALGVSIQVTYEPYFLVSNAKWVNSTHIVANKWHLVRDRGIAGAEIWMYKLPTNFTNPPAWGDQSSKNPGVLVVDRSNVLAQFGPEEPTPVAGASATVFTDKLVAKQAMSPSAQGDQSSAATDAPLRYVYYSFNTVDKTSWTYNKDPHKGIYAIMLYDMVTGETTQVTGGPGGAARPVISSDGTKLAFIRRTMFNTSLMIHDMATGDDFVLFNLGYQDQQEAYTPTGVYPNFAFDSTNTNIFAWGAGHFFRIPVSGGSAAVQIPFNVNVNISLATPPQLTHNVRADVNGTNFQTRVAVHAARNPNGFALAWSTLGDIYYANLTDGVMSAPTMLPSANQTHYYWPNINLATSQLVRTAWNDQTYGWIELMNMTTLQTTKLNIPPGRYVKPTFNLDGNQIMYAKANGDSPSGYRYTLNTGIYIAYLDNLGIPIPGQEAVWLTSGELADFTQQGTALVVTSTSYPYVVDEISVAPNTTSFGKLQNHLLQGLYVTSLAISPQRQLVAFVEFEVVYVQMLPNPITPDMLPLQITARLDNAAGNPATQILSKSGGDFLSFSGNSLSFGWANNFTTVDVSPMTSMGWGCPDQYCFLNNVSSKSYNLSLAAPVGTGFSTFVVFENATLVPMDPRNASQVYFDQKILIQGDTIIEIGTDFVNPPGAQVIDLAGGYVLPGFIDAHAHWDSAFTQRLKGATVQGWEYLMNLAFGVTTLHNPSAEYWSVWGDAELIKAGRKIGPRIFSTANVMFGAGGDLHIECNDVTAAQEALVRRAAFGGWSAKSYMIGCRAGRQKVLAAAANMGFSIVPEGAINSFWDQTYIIDGHATVEHSLPIAPFYNDILTLFAQGTSAWTPTMVVAFGGLWGDKYFYQESDVFLDPTVQQWVPDNIIQPISMRRDEASSPKDYHVFAIAQAATNVSQAGQRVNIGAHGQMQGIGYLWELKFMKSGGMSNYEVFKTATINPAQTFGLDSQLGSIYPGKLADLVILQPGVNPLADLDALRSIRWVMLDGKMYDTKTFAQVFPVPLDAPTLTVINTPSL